jgi:DNA (cytosine-5)-methyltransferase 1
VRLATIFSGIGAPEQAMHRIDPNFKTVFACELDKFARQSYSAIYDINEAHFHKDVHDMDGTQYQGKVDILVGGSPCQAFSIAGLRNGTNDEIGQLIYQYIRIVDEVKAPIIIYENVKGMLSISNGNTIKEFVQALRDIGYNCHYEVVNTKDYGVPQNRERIFLIGFLDHDAYLRFSFAPKQKLYKRLKDVLKDDVEDKYYLQDSRIMSIERKLSKSRGYTRTLLDYSYKVNIQTTVCSSNQEPKILQLGRGFNKGGEFDICPTLTKCSFEHNNFVLKQHIRKLTPLECWRLQDFPDSSYNKAKEAGISDSQLYKQAGNSMSVNVLEMIFRQITNI